MNRILKNGEHYCDLVDYAQTGKTKVDEVHTFGTSHVDEIYLYHYQIAVTAKLADEQGVNVALDLPDKLVHVFNFQLVYANPSGKLTYNCDSDIQQAKSKAPAEPPTNEA